MDKFLRPDDQRHSENVVNTVFLGKQQQTASANALCMYVHVHTLCIENWVTETAKHFVLIPAPYNNGARVY